MTEAQEKELTQKLSGLGYTSIEIMPGEDSIEMLHVNGVFICGAVYALSLSDDVLKTLIAETIQVVK